MRIVSRQTFLKLPAGVLYSNYQKTGDFGSLNVKYETLFDFNGRASDFCYQNCMEIQADGSEEWLGVIENAENNGASFSLDLDCGSRDGLFDNDQLFAVFEQSDLEAMYDLIGTCVPAVLSAPVDDVQMTADTEVPTSPLTKLLNDAPRCYYNYDPASGRRPCTIDIERYHGDVFKQSGLPSCPFVKECFTRSDCLYITGSKISEAAGAAQVAKELRQLVEKLTKGKHTNTWTIPVRGNDADLR